MAWATGADPAFGFAGPLTLGVFFLAPPSPVGFVLTRFRELAAPALLLALFLLGACAADRPGMKS